MRVSLVFLVLFLSVAWSGDEEEYYGEDWCNDGEWGEDGTAPCFPCTECDKYKSRCLTHRDAVCLEDCDENKCQNGGHIAPDDTQCKCTCAENYYGETCQIHNPHTDVAEFELTDPVSGVGNVNGQVCGTRCPFWDDDDYRQDGPYRCVRERYWGTEYCLLCGAAGLDLIDPQIDQKIEDYCNVHYCEDGIIITDSHVDKSKADGQTFGFDPECANRFFQNGWGTKKWSGKGIDLKINNQYDDTKLIWLWNAGKRSQECGNKACGRLGRSLSKPGDFKVGDIVLQIPAEPFAHWCDKQIMVLNNYPFLYKKNGQYFSFDEKCMNTFAGTDNWNAKVFTVSKKNKYAEQFKIKVFKKSKFFGGLSVGRVHPSSKVERYFWNVEDIIWVHKPCKGHFGECNTMCFKTYEITQEKVNEGEDCPHSAGFHQECESGEGDCIKTSCETKCEEQNDPIHFVCGVDGNSYKSECHAKCGGTTIANYGPCQCIVVADGLSDIDQGAEDYAYAVEDCNHYGCQFGLTCLDDLCQACPREENPEDGEIRLVDGSTEYNGRIEIAYSTVWGTICDDSFTEEDAKVACRSLGFGPPVSWDDESGGYGSEPIILDEMSCNGDEASLVDCGRNEWGHHDCGRTEQVSITCAAPEGFAVGGLNVSSITNNMALIAIGCTMFAGGYYMAMRKENSALASYGSM